MIRVAIICLSLFFLRAAHAQHQFTSTLDRDILSVESKAVNDSLFHTSVLPYTRSDMIGRDSLFSGLSGQGYALQFSPSDSANRFSFIGVPLVNLGAGYSNVSNALVQSGLGGAVSLSYKHKLYLDLSYFNDRSDFPAVISDQITATKVVPSGAYAKGAGNGFFSEMFGGLLEYAPNKIFNFQLGHGKNKLGDGYRSLLLSDVSNNNGFAKVTASAWKIKYVYLLNQYKVIDRKYTGYFDFSSKYATTHYLNFVHKWLAIGLFETVVWQGNDPKYDRGLDLNYLNPIIFFRPVEFSVGSSDNSLVGTNIKLTLPKGISIYGQVAIDEVIIGNVVSDIKKGRYFTTTDPFDGNDSLATAEQSGWWANKQGYQLGVKWHHAFGVKDLFVQGEINGVRPYTYSHVSGYSNYAHYNKPLAHPYGANFIESVVRVSYRHKKWDATVKWVGMKSGVGNDSLNVGQNVSTSYVGNRSDFGHYWTQGDPYNFNNTKISVGYAVYEKLRLRLVGTWWNRSGAVNENVFTLGITSLLWNNYMDY